MRQQSRSTVRYIFKNFIFILPLVFLSALLLALFQPALGVMDFFESVFDLISLNEKVVFENFYDSIFKFFSIVNVGQEEVFGINVVWFWIITFVITLISFCLAVSFVERHIKYGTRSYNNVIRSINEMFLYIVPFVLLVIAFYEIWMLLLSGCIALFSVLFGGLTFYTLSVTLTVLFYIAFFIIFSLAIMTPPCMLFDGYKFSFALGYSFHLGSVHFKEMVASILLNVFVAQALLSLFNLLISYIPQETICNILYYFLRFLFYLWWLIYLPCLSCCKYVDFTETSRADLKLKLF